MNDPTPSATPDAPTTRRYLLGSLTEEERDRLEARLLSDPAAYKQVLAAESELIDQYVDGELSTADRRAFEERLLAIERIRERVAFARSLRALAAEEAAAARSREPRRAAGSRRGERLAALLGLGRPGPSPVFAAVTAAAFVLLVGVSAWLGWRAADLAGRLESLQARAAGSESALERAREAQAGRAATDAEIGVEPADGPAAGQTDVERAAAGAAAELERERERAERLAERVAELESRPEPRPRITAAFLLTLATRSSSAVREIAIPEDADSVRFQLEGAGEAAGSLRARLLAAGGRVAWSGTARTDGPDGSPFVAELPAEILGPGRYELLLEQLPPDGEPELIGAYEFHVR